MKAHMLMPDDYATGGPHYYAVPRLPLVTPAIPLSRLPDRERMVVEARHGLGPYRRWHPRKGIARALGVSIARVRQIEARAERRLAQFAGAFYTNRR